MDIKDWASSNLLDIQEIHEDTVFMIPDVGTFLIVKPKNQTLFDNSFELILSEDEEILSEEVDYFAFCFGKKWYFCNTQDDVELNPLKHIGSAKISR